MHLSKTCIFLACGYFLARAFLSLPGNREYSPASKVQAYSGLNGIGGGMFAAPNSSSIMGERARPGTGARHRACARPSKNSGTAL